MLQTPKETEALVVITRLQKRLDYRPDYDYRKMFRERVKDLVENPEDHFLLRWLRARNLDIKKAEEMLRNYVDWTVKNEAELKDALYYSPPPLVEDRLRFKFLGLDSEGRPVLWLPIGRWELRRLLTDGYKKDVIQNQYRVLHELEASIAEQRRLTGFNQFVALLDSAELSFWKLAHYETIETVLRFFREFEAFYPEYLYAAYIVNNPRVFSYIFNLVKPLLSQHTLSKVQMFNYNQDKWGPVLLQGIPSEILPVEYGGSAEPILS